MLTRTWYEMRKPALQRIIQTDVIIWALLPKLTIAISSKQVAFVFAQTCASIQPAKTLIIPPKVIANNPPTKPSSKKVYGMVRVPAPRQMMTRLKIDDLTEPGLIYFFT